ncbi:winged-helix DNA-binding transcription factor family protein [Actinidia rufa]|uniref:Winged-helix DNA-binding transcription factor family protein n=1 Tax=Actinidia rufa TaxID=165716 RepID=A0A7J0E849_9ERIC|nr:winged-helix DNA-binding transcription factor family protein [Actinidia rufa]
MWVRRNHFDEARASRVLCASRPLCDSQICSLSLICLLSLIYSSSLICSSSRSHIIAATPRLCSSPSYEDINFVSHSTQSSNENGGSPQRRLSEGYPKDAQRAGGLSFAPETLELSDTGTSFTFNMDSALSHKAGGSENPRLLPLQQNLTSNEEVDGHLSCHLNLTLASSSLQVDKSQYSAKVPQQSHEIGISPELRSNANDKEDDDGTLSSSQEAPVKNQGPATSQIRVNDVFWEQFLTERPGISDAEEASSSFRENTYDDQEDRQSGRAVSRNGKNTEHLTL